jgi:hypothetical protein
VFFLLGYVFNIWAFNNLYDTDVRKTMGTVVGVALFTSLFGGLVAWVIALGSSQKITQLLAAVVALALNCGVWAFFILNMDRLSSQSWHGLFG